MTKRGKSLPTIYAKKSNKVTITKPKKVTVQEKSMGKWALPQTTRIN